MPGRTLAEWLVWQEQLHPQLMDLGLERVGRVYRALGSPRPGHRVVTIAGTNGKGSSGALLEAIAQAAGWRTGLYSSPHLLRYNERIRLQGEPADDAALCRVFEQIDQARGEESLTYFEFGTLAALLLMAEQYPDLAILEVGLGGRLDAVNLVDSDIALITPIGLDHCDWLGPDRAAISREKAGIARCERPLVCNDSAPPAALIESAGAYGAVLFRLGQEYSYRVEGNHWSWQGLGQRYGDLPFPALAGAHQIGNAAGVLAVVQLLKLPSAQSHVVSGLEDVRLPGRMQRLSESPEILLDVCHNPAGAQALAEHLRQSSSKGRTLALFGSLQDKDVAGILEPLRGLVDQWHVVDTTDLSAERGEGAARAAAYLGSEFQVPVESCSSLRAAWQRALKSVDDCDRVVVFGCFALVAAALALFSESVSRIDGVERV